LLEGRQPFGALECEQVFCQDRAVFLSGISVPDRDVLDFARQLRTAGFDAEAEKLEDAHRNEIKLLGLAIPEREAVLRVLDDCPDGSLAELRAVILRDVTWFRQQGLA
jgi:hypothetical protein